MSWLGSESGWVIRFQYFLLSGTCLFCGTILVRDLNNVHIYSVSQPCWAAFYWFFFFTCANPVFSIYFRNLLVAFCTIGVLIRITFSSSKTSLFLGRGSIVILCWHGSLFQENNNKASFHKTVILKILFTLSWR